MFWSTRVPPSITPKVHSYILPLPGSEPEQCDRHQQARILQWVENSLRLLSPRNREIARLTKNFFETLPNAKMLASNPSRLPEICAVPVDLSVTEPGYVIYAFKEGSIRVINQSAKDTAVIASPAPQKNRLALKPGQDHFKLSNASKAIRSWPSYGKIPWNTMKYLGPDRQAMDFPVSWGTSDYRTDYAIRFSLHPLFCTGMTDRSIFHNSKPPTQTADLRLDCDSPHSGEQWIVLEWIVFWIYNIYIYIIIYIYIQCIII